MTVQEQNWELMSWLNMSWFDCEKLAEEDKTFLLTKVDELKEQSKQYYEAQAEAAQKAHEQQQQQEPQAHAGPTMSDGRAVKPW